MLTTVLLDVDGTLIDSNDAHAETWVKALNDNGFETSFDEIRPLIGMGGDKILMKIANLKEDHPTAKKISDERTKNFCDSYLPKLKPFPGARELVLKLKREGLNCVVATSSGEDQLESLLFMAGVDDLLELRTSKDDADKSKPSPDIILAALEQADARPDQAVMIGDTPYDIEAALKAGVTTIALLSGGWPAEKLRRAAAIYKNPMDLVEHFESSMLVRAQLGIPELTT